MSNPTVECSRCGKRYYAVGDSMDCPHQCYHERCHADLERQLAEAERLLNFTPDQLKLLADPEKLAYVEWNMSSTYTLQLMCETYRAGKMEVREAERQLAEAQGKLEAVRQWRDGLVNEPPWNMDTLDRILGGKGD